jgi:predicted MPP superfamily phosphohydrolase
MPFSFAKQISRRDLLKAGLVLGGAGGLVGFAANEPYELSREHVSIKIPRLPQVFADFRIAQLSDLHFGEFILEEHLNSVVNAVNATRPDLVVITGDFVTKPNFGSDRRAAERTWPCAAILRLIQAKYGLVATLGNHDHLTDAAIVTKALEDSGITVLRNRAHPIEANGVRFWIAGIDDALGGHADPTAALKGISKAEPVIAAIHEPDFADVLQAYNVNFQISGHSHGGQVRLPLVGALYLPRMGRKYPMGLRRAGRLPLYTNRGIGITRVPFRFMCPPEITVYTLQPLGRA